jgi:FixJ family two-component response regulator
LGQLTIFVVDDERPIADTWATILRAAGFQVRTFYDGADVLAAGECSPDIVITDLYMPRVDGFALAEWLEECHPKCRIVMITGNSACLGKIADRGEHFVILEKPFSPHRLLEVVNALAKSTAS